MSFGFILSQGASFGQFVVMLNRTIGGINNLLGLDSDIASHGFFEQMDRNIAQRQKAQQGHQAYGM